MTDVPPITVGHGNPGALMGLVESVKFEPKMEIIVPGATGACTA